VICARETSDGIKVSADNGAMLLATTVTRFPERLIVIEPCQFQKAGTPFLLIAADPPPPKGQSLFTVAGYRAGPADYTKAKDGLAMTVMPAASRPLPSR